MGSITISFFGLAVHLDQKDAPELDVKHRVVFIANPKPAVIHQQLVQPHQPELCFPSGAVEALNGVTLTIPNATGRGFKKDASFAKVPRLSTGQQKPGTLEPEVVYGRQSPAGVYFDTDYGTLSSCRMEQGAIATHLRVTTDGHPLLQVTPFEGPAKPPYRFDQQHVKVRIVNTAVQDDKADFLLSYLVLTVVPAVPFMPLQQPDLPLCDGQLSDLDPSCSNSSYP